MKKFALKDFIDCIKPVEGSILIENKPKPWFSLMYSFFQRNLNQGFDHYLPLLGTLKVNTQTDLPVSFAQVSNQRNPKRIDFSGEPRQSWWWWNPLHSWKSWGVRLSSVSRRALKHQTRGPLWAWGGISASRNGLCWKLPFPWKVCDFEFWIDLFCFVLGQKSP